MKRFILNPKCWLWPLAVWAAVVVLSLSWNWRELDNHARELAANEGRFVFQMMEAASLWNAGHGGVYARIDAHTKPNPYLDVPERDIVSRSGKKLTLLNPAYMTRQLAELINEQGGMVLHLSSLKPLNPGNAANEWETAALQSFERGEREHSAFIEESGRTYSRYMAPLRVKPACMACHKKQGYQVGDIRGGLSVVFPADPFLAPLRAEKRNLAAAHLAVWLLLSGVSVFFLMRLREQMLLLQQAKEEQEEQVTLRTAELQAQAQERGQIEAQLRQLVNSSGGAIYGVDLAGDCTFCNPVALHLLGYQDAVEVLGRNMHGLVHAACRDKGGCRLNVYRDGTAAHAEDEVFLRADGSAMQVEYRSHPIFSDGEVVGAVVTFADTGARLEAHKDLWNKANYDELTNLPNRNLFYDRLEQAIAQSARTRGQVALLFVDLDGFKVVNEQLGHAAGDELLRLAAQRLEDCVRDSDTVARMGSDEFTIVLSPVGQEAEVEAVAVKALERLAQPFKVGDTEAHVSGSIGIALYPRDGSDVITLIKHADAAMYRAKESGRDAYRFFPGSENHGG